MTKIFFQNFARLILALTLFTALGCAHMDATGTVDFAPDAETNYALGLQAIKDKRHLDAVQYFEHVRYRHPYAAVAALADLALADNYFVQDRFAEAAESYKSFITLRPHHPKVDYAEYRMALSHYEDIPMDLFILPPSCEKDQGAVRGAAKSFSEFLKKYPDSEYAPEAKEKLQEVIERLADHEMSIGRFYARHDHFKSAIARFEVLIRDFPQSRRMSEALYGLIYAQMGAGEHDKARETLDRLVTEFPESEEAKDAKDIREDIADSEADWQKHLAKEAKKAAEREEKEKKKLEEQKARAAEKAARKAEEAQKAAAASEAEAAASGEESEAASEDAASGTAESENKNASLDEQAASGEAENLEAAEELN